MTNGNPDACWRLFVAIPVPETVRGEMVRVQEELQPFAPRPAIRWANPEQFHLTLKFLGAVPTDQLELVKKSVQTACVGCRALRLEAGGLGFFPNDRSPLVIWAGVNDADGRLAGLQKDIETGLRQFSKVPGVENFTGHVTLGRFKHCKRCEVEKLVAQVGTIHGRRLGVWTAREVAIMRSELSTAGARHRPLAVFKLVD